MLCCPSNRIGAILGLGELAYACGHSHHSRRNLTTEIRNVLCCPSNRIGAILGLGLAYAGSHREEISELLSPLVADTDAPLVSGVQPHEMCRCAVLSQRVV